MKTLHTFSVIFFTLFAVACGSVSVPTSGDTTNPPTTKKTETVIIQAVAKSDFESIYIVHDHASFDLKNLIAKTWQTSITQVVDGPHTLQAFCDNEDCTAKLSVTFNGFAGCLQDNLWHYSSPVTMDGCKAEPVTQDGKWIIDDEFPGVSYEEEIPVDGYADEYIDELIESKLPFITKDVNCVSVESCMEDMVRLAEAGVMVRPYLDFFEVPVGAGYTADRPLVRMLREELVSNPSKYESFFVHNDLGERVCVWPDAGNCASGESLWLIDLTNLEAIHFIVDFYFNAMQPYLEVFSGFETDRVDGFCHWWAGEGRTLKLFTGQQGDNHMSIDEACQKGYNPAIAYARSKFPADYIISGRTSSHEYCGEGLLDGVTYELSFYDNIGIHETQVNKLQDFAVIDRLGRLARSCNFVVFAHTGDDTQRERAFAASQLYDNVFILHDGGVTGHQGATYDQSFYRAPGAQLKSVQYPWAEVKTIPDATLTSASNRIEYGIKGGQCTRFHYRLEGYVDGDSILDFPGADSITEWNWSTVYKCFDSDTNFYIEYFGPGKAHVSEISVFDPANPASTGYFYSQKENLEAFYSVDLDGVSVTDERGNSRELPNRTGWISY